MDDYHGASKKRRLAPSVKPRAIQEIRSETSDINTLIQVPDEDYQRLRLKLVDSVAKAM